MCRVRFAADGAGEAVIPVRAELLDLTCSRIMALHLLNRYSVQCDYSVFKPKLVTNQVAPTFSPSLGCAIVRLSGMLSPVVSAALFAFWPLSSAFPSDCGQLLAYFAHLGGSAPLPFFAPLWRRLRRSLPAPLTAIPAASRPSTLLCHRIISWL